MSFYILRYATAAISMACAPVVWAASYQQVYDVAFTPPSNSSEPVIAAEQSVYAMGKLPAYRVDAAQFDQSRKQQLTKLSLIHI